MGKLELSAASAIPAEPRYRWETVSVNLSTDLASLLCPNLRIDKASVVLLKFIETLVVACVVVWCLLVL